MNKLELLIHPIRLRIVTEMRLEQKTARQLAAALPDVPQSSLYRHIHTLVEGGVLLVVAETPIRGTVEKIYQVHQESIHISAADYEQFTSEQLRDGINFLFTSIMGEFGRSVEQYHPKELGYDDLFLFRMSKYLTPQERDGLNHELEVLMAKYSHQQDAERPDQRHYSGLMVYFPTATTAED